MSAIKFSKQMRQPNHKEVDYWVDYNSDPYGSRIKYYNGGDWVDLINANGDSINLGDYFNKSQINSMLIDKASSESVNLKADKSEINELIKNIEIQELDNGITLVIFKYDGTNVAVSLPIADSTSSGIVTSDDFKNFVKQHQLQSLYSEMYDKLAEIRSEYQKKLKAGRNIVIDDDNTIHSESDIIVEWDLIENKPQFHEVATSGDYNDLLNTPDDKISTLQQSLSNEVNRATAAELTLSSRIDAHFDVTNTLIEQKADKADTYTKDLINEKLSGVYKIQGSCTFEKLPAVDNVVGDVYNITNVFTLDGTEYPIGTNVVWTESGWDALSGVFDTVALEEAIQTVSDNLANETVRATGAERTLDDKFNQYLPLTGGTLSGGLTITAGNFIMNGSITLEHLLGADALFIQKNLRAKDGGDAWAVTAFKAINNNDERLWSIGTYGNGTTAEYIYMGYNDRSSTSNFRIYKDKYIFGGANVGIGTTSPAYKLDVNGDGNINGNLNVSKQIKSTVSTGTAPISVSSTTMCPKLNANYLGGYTIDDVINALQPKVFDFTSDTVVYSDDWIKPFNSYIAYYLRGTADTKLPITPNIFVNITHNGRTRLVKVTRIAADSAAIMVNNISYIMGYRVVGEVYSLDRTDENGFTTFSSLYYGYKNHVVISIGTSRNTAPNYTVDVVAYEYVPESGIS